MSSLNLILGIFIISSIYCIPVNGRNTNHTRNGKTYFLQLKNVGDGEIVYRPLWRKNLKHKLGKSTEEYEILGRLVQTEESSEEESEENSIEVIDENWNKNTKASITDFPDVINDFYDIFTANETHKIHNATQLRFIFEVDAIDNEIFKYDLSNMDIENDTIVDAELYIYRHQNEKLNLPEAGNYVARLYQITENITNPDLTRAKPDGNRLLNVVYVSSITDDWQVFKVKTAIKNWLNGDENLGFLVTFKDNADKLMNVNFAHKNTSDDIYQSFIVLYLKDKNNKTVHYTAPKETFNFKNSIKGLKMLQNGEIPCSRHIWYINFHELGWDNFILEPKGYMAYKCKGSCKSPLCADYSNYGKILNIYKHNNADLTGPGCVPTSFKPLLMMYINNYNNLIIRYYEDMIVEKCGCR